MKSIFNKNFFKLTFGFALILIFTMAGFFLAGYSNPYNDIEIDNGANQNQNNSDTN